MRIRRYVWMSSIFYGIHNWYNIAKPIYIFIYLVNNSGSWVAPTASTTAAHINRCTIFYHKLECLMKTTTDTWLYVATKTVTCFQHNYLLFQSFRIDFYQCKTRIRNMTSSERLQWCDTLTFVTVIDVLMSLNNSRVHFSHCTSVVTNFGRNSSRFDPIWNDLTLRN